MSAKKIPPEPREATPSKNGVSYYGHPTMTIELTKRVEVDVKIAPVVTWLNDTFENIVPTGSCQGDPGDGADSTPHVVFRLLFASELDLAQLLMVAQEYATCEVCWKELGGLEYSLRFHDIASLEAFKKQLGLGGAK
jgi:hypothetical protein